MSLERAQAYLRQWNREAGIVELDVSSATVPLAARALGIEEARIAKTLSFIVKGEPILIVAAGDAKIDNKKYRAEFGAKARMIERDLVEPLIGHSVGGVCPFGINAGVKVYLDLSLRRFATVFPACGSANSAIEMSCEELAEVGKATAWIDVCAIEQNRLKQQLDFIVEIDRVKNILRQSRLFDGSRFENDAEHSWTICVMASLLREYANIEVNMERVLLMLLIHDIVEIDAGDTFLYAKERDTAPEREAVAAARIFGKLPADQATRYVEIWREFESRQSTEAKYAAVFDRLEPVLQNYVNEGYTWKKFNITKSQVLAKNKHIAEGSETIWNFFLQLIDDCVARGYLEDA